MKKSVLTAMLLITLCVNAFAQGGSNYSIFGIGDLHSAVGSTYESMAGTSIALPDELGINTVNPAMWSKANLTRLRIGYRFNQNYEATDNFDIAQNNGKVNGITGIFSIDTGIAASFGIIPYSSVNYFVANPFSTIIDDIGFEGRTHHKGLGGINKGYFGAAAEIFDGLSLGVEGYTIFGKTEFSTYTYFLVTDFYESLTTRDDNYQAFGYKAGLYYDGIKNIGIGAYYESAGDVDLKSIITHGTPFAADTSFTCKSQFAIPPAFGVGLSYKTGKFGFGADFSMQDFSDLQYQEAADGKFRNNMRLSLGMARYGNRSSGAEFLDKATYRFGVSYQQLYYEIEGSGIDEIYLSTGMSMPLTRSALLDVGLALGRRGTKNNGLIEEYFGRLFVDISIGEIWFKPFRRGY